MSFSIFLLCLLSSSLVVFSKPLNLAYHDARTNFSPEFLRSACQRPVHSAWSSCIRGLAPSATGTDNIANLSRGTDDFRFQKRAGRAFVLPPFPRFAVVNPMHALVDHLWAYATVYSACFDKSVLPDPSIPPTVILLGVRRKQIEGSSVERDITTRLDLDLEHLIPVKRPDEMPDPLDGHPTWGQWLLHLWVSASVPSANIIYEDDLSKLSSSSSICFDEGILSLDADFFGTAFRSLRIDFRPPSVTEPYGDALPWADYPERWKVRGLDHFRSAISSKLKLDMVPRTLNPDVLSQISSAQGRVPAKLSPSVNPGKNGTWSKVRILIHSRLEDSRRRWSNAPAAVTKLQNDLANHVEIRVLDALEDMSILEQARAYNWADVLIGVHGASMANTIFMRDESSVIEVWRCCHDKIEGEDNVQRAWTGWLLSRMRMSLSYIGCDEVDAQGSKLSLPPDHQHLATDSLCDLPEHLNPAYISVNASEVTRTVRLALEKTKEEVTVVPRPPISRVPESVLHRSSHRRNVILMPEWHRTFAPEGPAWTTAAVWTTRVQKALEQFDRYLAYLSEKSFVYWKRDSELTLRGQAPVALDSIVEPVHSSSDTYAWHVGLIPPESNGAFLRALHNAATEDVNDDSAERPNISIENVPQSPIRGEGSISKNESLIAYAKIQIFCISVAVAALAIAFKTGFFKTWKLSIGLLRL